MSVLIGKMGKECYNIHRNQCILYNGKDVNGKYNKLMEKLKEKGITTYTIRQKALIPQGTLAKLKMCSGATMEEIEQKLKEYKDTHNGKDFMCDVSTKTIEDICQLLQCQPEDLIEWKVDLKPELAYETRFKE